MAHGAPFDALERLRGLPPICRVGARVLILGSMPGAASLAAGEYYAHPRNAFWPILGALFDFDPLAPYRVRVAALRQHHIAVWDVLAECTRPGSADAAIDLRSARANDFAAFFRRYPSITGVFFNGSLAAQLFHRRVASEVKLPPMSFAQLPSTSPAHASRTVSAKLEVWRAVAETLGRAQQ